MALDTMDTVCTMDMDCTTGSVITDSVITDLVTMAFSTKTGPLKNTKNLSTPLTSKSLPLLHPIFHFSIQQHFTSQSNNISHLHSTLHLKLNTYLEGLVFLSKLCLHYVYWAVTLISNKTLKNL